MKVCPRPARSTPGTFAQIAFDGHVLSDENVYTVSTSGGFGTISGSFCSDPAVCTIPVGAIVTTVPEHASFSQPFLSASWVSDPEPASGLVILAGLAGLAWARRRRRKRT
ncbi:MAG: PEP-CTERM sorting domain-containing protein [Gemmataceae bacterium]